MSRKHLIFMAAIGLALVGATFVQVRGTTGRGPLATSLGSAPTAEAADSAAAIHWVAAEGRVVTYPGGEVQVAVERSGKLVALRVRENDRVEAGALIAEIDSEELRAALDEVTARLGETDADLLLAEKTLERRRDLVARRVAAQQELDTAERDVNAARARRESLRAEAHRLRVQIDRCRVVAPITGTVTLRRADAGEVLEAGDPVLTLMDLDHLRVSGEADESDAGRLLPGAPVRITADGWPGHSWEGTVEEVSGWVGPRTLKPVDPARPSDTRVLEFKVKLAPGTPLKVGTTVELRVGARG